ncbi:MAG: AraC family transcriptional regulator [Caulobacteraceae bacterium]|nr:AraC family transcriptional regulator [Caulobacteraceae bacterium]
MSLSNRALWVIDRNLSRPLSLAEIADACGVSRHHLAHAFGEAVGMTVMEYVRARRLSDAAGALAAGAQNILDVAIVGGYGSHEAFSRAFRTRFGATPEEVRRSGTTAGLDLIAPREIEEPIRIRLGPPRFQDADEILALGLRERRSFGDLRAIADQWRRFGPEVGAIRNKADPIPIGVLMQSDDEGAFDYACAVEVTDFSDAPADLARLRVSAQRYVVFHHAGHVSGLGATYRAILEDLLPEAGLTLAEGPSLERHRPAFDPRTGEGGVDVWLPLV